MNNPSEKLIAVVGTMKAGKSTVINAIVGREVLPTRELPMTTIPTLVRHVPGQTEPVLEFSQKSTIEALLPQLATAISNPKNTSIIESSLCCSYNDQLIPSILDFVYRNKKLKKQYAGSVQILEFVRNLNDFTRLCEDLNIDFPFEKFNHIQNLPTISVEFQSLKYLNNPAQVQLALLDTPGPNEYRQTHLLKLMPKEQLQKASVVLAVLDYTQLNSDSNIVNNEIKKISEITGNRLYAIVNKFDNQNRNSQPKESIVDFVANTLMEGNISTNHVFPVSSYNAYLANRALNTLDLHQELPDHETEPWVEDFGLQAFGRRWKNNISDLVETKYAANDLWHDSLLQEPLNAIFQSLTEQSHYHKNQTSENKATATVTPSHLSFLKAQSMPITIQDLQAEATRLVDIHIDIIENILHIDDIQESTASEDKIESINESHLKTLKGEKAKLENLEAVIAVVGTMKAGKSTTINAIVGTEVLPNRELPMTALPTLIRHTPGKAEPTLHFKNKLPIEILLSKIFEALNNCNPQTISEIGQDKHIKELADLIRSSNNTQEIYKSHYFGSNQIFNFLKSLNDLVRLSKKLNIDFPFENYQIIDEIPFIEVEFTSLKGIKQNHGKLALLDTPGPNEAKQNHLRDMLKDQLRKSSAVLAILDYTQLKSDANEEVNSYLIEIASISKGRLYALVNKFDEQGENSLELDEVKNLVANQLLEKEISEDCVFPISSRNAYLSNRALQEIKAYGKLPSHKEQPWVKSFGIKALGSLWEEDILDTNEVTRRAAKMWSRSLFEKPLEKVIKTSHQKSSFIAIDSTIAKLPDITKKLKEGLEIKTKSFQKTIDFLEKEINNLQEKINEVSRAENNANKKKDESIKALKEKTKSTLNNSKKSISKEIDYYLAEGKTIEQSEQEEAMKKDYAKTRPPSILNNLSLKLELGRRFSSDFEKGSTIIKLYDKEKAENLILKINTSISNTVENFKKSIKEDLSKSIKDFDDNFINQITKDINPIINNIKSELNKEGFTISLNIPNTSTLTLSESSPSIIENIIEIKQESVTRRRRKSNFWGTVCEWFGTSDLGYESYQTTEDRFVINIEKIRGETINKIDKIFGGLDQSIFEKIEAPLQEGINNFFKELQTNVNQLKEHFEQSIAYTQKNKEERDRIYENLIKNLRILESSEKDIKQLETEVKEFPQNFTQNL